MKPPKYIKIAVTNIQIQIQKFLLRKEIYIEHQNILTALNDQDWSVNLLSGSRHGRLLLYHFNINYNEIWKRLDIGQTNGKMHLV